jgi:hypothetical protein
LDIGVLDYWIDGFKGRKTAADATNQMLSQAAWFCRIQRDRNWEMLGYV